MRIVLLFLLSLTASGCLLGLGRASVAQVPVGPTQSTEIEVTRVDSSGGVWGRAVSGRRFEAGDFGLGVYGVALPMLDLVSPEGLAGGRGLGWLYGVGGQASLGPFGLSVDYLTRYAEVSYTGGFSFASRLAGPSVQLAYAVLPALALEVGGGPLWGRAGVGGGGNVANDSALSLVSGAASGFQAGGRASLFLSAGGDLLMKTEVRFEARFQHYTIESTRLPPSATSFSLGMGLALSFL